MSLETEVDSNPQSEPFRLAGPERVSGLGKNMKWEKGISQWDLFPGWMGAGGDNCSTLF
jgi:hypothetical protein